MWVLSFVGVVRLVVVWFAVGVGVCNVALFSFGVGWCFWQVVMAVLLLSCGVCISVSFHVSRSFLFRKGLFLVSLRMLLSCLVSWSQRVVVSSFNVFLWSSKLTWRGGSVGLCSCCTGLIIFMVKKKYPAKMQGT